MTKCKDIITAIEEFAPPELAEIWDNNGLLVGDSEKSINRVLLCLDVSSEVVDEAIKFGADLIVAHHPVLIPSFSQISRITEQEVTGRIIIKLIKNDISVFAAHTNFDSAEGGLIDILANKLDIQNLRHFTDDECRDEWGKPTEKFGREGTLKTAHSSAEKNNHPTLLEFTKFVEQKLNVTAIKYVGDANRKLKTAALCCGGGDSMLYAAYRAGADVFIIGDVRHHVAHAAAELGIAVIDAGHYETEIIFCEFMKEFLGKKFPAIEIGIPKTGGFFKA